MNLASHCLTLVRKSCGLFLVLAATCATAQALPPAPQVAGMLHNATGDVIYPGEWQKARDAILAGRAINYQGASGSCDFDDHWYAADPIFESWKINMDGTTSHVMTIIGTR